MGPAPSTLRMQDLRTMFDAATSNQGREMVNFIKTKGKLKANKFYSSSLSGKNTDKANEANILI